jgi:N-acetylglucosaminyl-diphospho-decaprenol L-rhamnosyltransferase
MAKSAVIALVLNYRTPELACECLRSLVPEGIAGALVVDNSADQGNSAARLAASLTERPLPFAVQVVDSGSNLGFAAGVNFGLRQIQARHGESDVLLINSDALATPGMLAVMQAAVGGQPGPALVDAEQVDQRRAPTVDITHYQRATGLLLRSWQPGAFRFLSGCCLLIPATLARAPLFDEDFFIYGEDIELSWRLGRAGVQLLHSTEAQVIHGGGKSTRPGSFFYEYHMLRGHMLLARKTAGNRLQAVAFVSLRYPIFFLRALWRSLRAGRWTPLRAWLRVIFGRQMDPVLPAPDA